MATIQAILDVAELLNREIQLQSSEADVARGIIAYNSAKRHFEARVALKPNILGGDIGTVTTAASTESTAFPSGVLRIDKLQYIDPGTSRPAWDLLPVHHTGGHAFSGGPTLLSASSAATGKPRSYYTDGSNIYWAPLPSGTHTVRYYGFTIASDASAAGDTFPYPDICIDPFGAFVAQLFRVGLDDPVQEGMLQAAQLFDPVLDVMSKFQRERARVPTYRSIHRV